MNFNVHCLIFGTRLRKNGRILGLDKADQVIRLDLDGRFGSAIFEIRRTYGHDM